MHFSRLVDPNRYPPEIDIQTEFFDVTILEVSNLQNVWRARVAIGNDPKFTTVLSEPIGWLFYQ